MQTVSKHHYVPEFLLKKWAPNPHDSCVRGYYWNGYRNGISSITKGAKAFCFEFDLFSVNVSHLPSDVLETDFLVPIDTQGAAAVDRMLKDSTAALTGDDRSDFTRLLFSLEYRRPHMVHQLRECGPKIIKQDIDGDESLRSALQQHGFTEDPSSYAKKLGCISEDHAVAQVQTLVDDRNFGQKFVNSHWSIAQTRPEQGTFILSDRPFFGTARARTIASWRPFRAPPPKSSPNRLRCAT